MPYYTDCPVRDADIYYSRFTDDDLKMEQEQQEQEERAENCSIRMSNLANKLALLAKQIGRDGNSLRHNLCDTEDALEIIEDSVNFLWGDNK